MQKNETHPVYNARLFKPALEARLIAIHMSIRYTMPVQHVTQLAIFPMKFYKERLLNNQSHLCEVNHV